MCNVAYVWHHISSFRTFLIIHFCLLINLDQDLKQVQEEITLWIPEQPQWPFYGPVVADKTDCSDSNLMMGLQFINMTCPIKAGSENENNGMTSTSLYLFP